MNKLLPIALVALLSLPVAAQTHLADSSGVYLGLGAGYHSSSVGFGTVASFGYRQANGLDYGIGVRLDHRPPSAQVSGYQSTSLGATLGYTRALGKGVRLRMESAASFRAVTYDRTQLDQSLDYAGSAIGLDVSASISRPFRLVGSFRVDPTLGVYANGTQALTESAYGFGVQSATPTLTGLDGGVQVGLPLSFRALGADMTVPLTARFSLRNQHPSFGVTPPPFSGGVRVNF